MTTMILSRSESAASRKLETMAWQHGLASKSAARRAALYAAQGPEGVAKAEMWRSRCIAASLKAESMARASRTLKRRKYVHNPAKGIPWGSIGFLLGWYPDRHVAAALGVVHSTVIWARRQRGWPAAYGRGRPSKWRELEPFPGIHPRGWIPDLADPFQRAYATAEDGEGLEAVASLVSDMLKVSQ